MRGNITKRGKSSWQLKFDVPPVNGNRQQRYATVKGTYRDAQKELTRLLGEADQGTLPDPCTSTLSEYLRAWLDGQHGLSPKTLERYRELSERQIIPHLGATKLQRLKPEQVQQWHSTLIAHGLSARTVGHAHRVLRLVLQCAVKNRTLPRNVAAVHSPPKVEPSEVEILSADQIADVLTKLDGHVLYPIVSLALATGMRRGELLGLQWGDIDLDAATICVERSIEETKAGLRVKPPKTKRGRRSITLPPEAVSMMRAHKIRSLEIRLALSIGKFHTDIAGIRDRGRHAAAPPQSHQGLVASAQRLGAAASFLPCVPTFSRLHAHPGGRGCVDRQSPIGARTSQHHPRRLWPSLRRGGCRGGKGNLARVGNAKRTVIRRCRLQFGCSFRFVAVLPKDNQLTLF